MPYFIMAGRTMKNLFMKPSTRLYPSRKRQSFSATRGHIDIDGEKCIFCGICQKKCPTGAISVARKEKTWEIERLRCIACGCCVDACPKSCLSMKGLYSLPVTEAEVAQTRYEINGVETEKTVEPEAEKS
ncbi:MAG TPA: 4Fe-4S dicluster domain-containing protein [Desulfomonilia bacterium]